MATLTGVRGIDFAESALGDAQPPRQTVNTSMRRALDEHNIISAGRICPAARFAREFGLLNWGLSINLTALRFSYSPPTPYTISLPYHEL
jgi:hypothetical protein